MLKKKKKIFIGLLIVLLVALALPILWNRQFEATTIGEQVDFSVHEIVSYGAGCKNANGESYTRVTVKPEEISEIKAILSDVEIVQAQKPKDTNGVYIMMEIGDSE